VECGAEEEVDRTCREMQEEDSSALGLVPECRGMNGVVPVRVEDRVVDESSYDVSCRSFVVVDDDSFVFAFLAAWRRINKEERTGDEVPVLLVQERAVDDCVDADDSYLYDDSTSGGFFVVDDDSDSFVVLGLLVSDLFSGLELEDFACHQEELFYSLTNVNVRLDLVLQDIGTTSRTFSLPISIKGQSNLVDLQDTIFFEGCRFIVEPYTGLVSKALNAQTCCQSAQKPL
jgi:hypothetical protein